VCLELAFYLTLPVATNVTPQLLKVAMRETEALYRSGYQYKKAGVIMLGLVPEKFIQGNLFESDSDWQKDQILMQVLDRINTRFGSGALQYASSGLRQGG
jgi:DNA polymerase V